MKPPDYCCNPLCRWCHTDGPEAQHKANETAWWAARGIDPLLLAEQLHGIWEADHKDAQGIDEAIGMAHIAIERHVWQAFNRANQQFIGTPSHEHAAESLSAFKIYRISMGVDGMYENRIAELTENMDAILKNTEAA